MHPNGSMESFGADGKPKKTSATPEKLAAGYGKWELQTAAPTAPKAEPVAAKAQPRAVGTKITAKLDGGHSYLTITGGEGGLEFVDEPIGDFGKTSWVMTPAIRTEIAASINEVHADLPGLGPVLLAPGTGHGGTPGGWIALTQTNGSMISFAPGYGDEDYMTNIAKGSVGFAVYADGDTGAADARRGVALHEMGHVVVHRLRHLTATGRADVAALLYEMVTPASVGNTHTSNQKPVPRYKVDHLRHADGAPRSVYANKNAHEFFAEAYADGMLFGDDASEAGKRAVAIARKHFGKKGEVDDSSGAKQGGSGAHPDSAGGGQGAGPQGDLGQPGKAGGAGGTQGSGQAPVLVTSKVEEVEEKSKPLAPGQKFKVPMSFEEVSLDQVPKHIADPDFFFQQKVDGIRGQLVIEPGKAPWFRSKAGTVLVNSTAEKITKPLLAKLGTMPEGGPSYSIDGELLDGKWHVFDMVIDGQEDMPWEQRMAVAEKWVAQIQANGVTQVTALPTARTPEEKKALWDAVVAGGGEGVMMKKKSAKYAYGVKVGDILKAKVTSTADVVVMEVGVGGKSSVVIGVHENGKLRKIGSVSTIGKEKSGAIAVGDVLEIEYLWAHPVSGNVTQPRIKKKRPDKDPKEAVMSQLRLSNKAVLDKKVMATASTGEPHAMGMVFDYLMAEAARLLVSDEPKGPALPPVLHSEGGDPGVSRPAKFAPRPATGKPNSRLSGRRRDLGRVPRQPAYAMALPAGVKPFKAKATAQDEADSVARMAEKPFGAEWGDRAFSIRQAGKRRPKIADLFDLHDPEANSISEREEIGRQVGEAFEFTSSKGYTARAHFNSCEVRSNKGLGRTWIKVSGDIMDADGEEAGEFQRQLVRDDATGEIMAYNSLLDMFPGHTDTGFATEFNRRNEDWYIANGVTRVEVHAGLSHGGYVWARAGFDWAPLHDGGKTPSQVVDRLLNRIAHVTLGPPAGSDAIDRRPAVLAEIAAIRARATKALEGSEDFPTPYELSQIGYVPGEVAWPGRDGMMGTQWTGVKHLVPATKADDPFDTNLADPFAHKKRRQPVSIESEAREVRRQLAEARAAKDRLAKLLGPDSDFARATARLREKLVKA